MAGTNAAAGHSEVCGQPYGACSANGKPLNTTSSGSESFFARHKTRPHVLGLYNWLLRSFPFGGSIKIRFLRFCGVNIAQTAYLAPDVTIRASGKVSIGDGCYIGQGVCIECIGGILEIGARCEVQHGTLIAANYGSQIVIGDDVHIAHNVSIKGSTHKINSKGEGLSVAGESRFLDIHIGSGCWVCAGVIVLPGVKIGSRNILAAGAVVTRDTPNNVLMAGVPAVVKRHY